MFLTVQKGFIIVEVFLQETDEKAGLPRLSPVPIPSWPLAKFFNQSLLDDGIIVRCGLPVFPVR
jgi:hypothetical protein